MGTIVNFGTSQSGIKDIVMNKDDPKALSSAFYNTILLRIIIFLAFMFSFSLLELADLHNYNFYLFSIPIIFSEVLNPMFLYLGKEKLALYNLTSFISKILIIIALILLIQGDEDAIWINFIIGTINALAYLLLVIRGVIKYRLSFNSPDKSALLKLSVSNFYLVGNNISVHLQQSLMIFSINLWGNPLWLGAYSVCDKIIGAVKMLISSISNSIYPKAALLYKKDPKEFVLFRNKMQKILALAFFIFSVCLNLFSEYIIILINGKPDLTAETLLRIMAFLPTLAALNSINVLEFLIRDHTIFIFRIAMILLILAAALSRLIVYSDNLIWFGTYTLLIEGSALLMYEYLIRKKYPLNV